MEHIGIDLGSRGSHICVRSDDAQVVLRVPTKELGSWLAQQGAARVVIETCCETFAVADLAEPSGHKVSVVPASVVRPFSRADPDRVDATRAPLGGPIAGPATLAEHPAQLKRVPERPHKPAPPSRPRSRP